MLSWAASVCSWSNFYANELKNKQTKNPQNLPNNKTHPKIKFETLFPVCQKTALNLICSTVLLVSPDTPVLHGAKHEHSQNQWQNLKGYSRTSFYGASAGFNSLGPSQLLSLVTTPVPHSQLGKYHPLEATW